MDTLSCCCGLSIEQRGRDGFSLRTIVNSECSMQYLEARLCVYLVFCTGCFYGCSLVIGR